MSNSNSNYQSLIANIDYFIRKYYKNQLLKGAIYFGALFFILLLLVSFLEYFGQFNNATRTLLFYSFLAVNLVVLGKFVVIPLFKLNRFGKVISHEQAAQIIGEHFPEVSDKLLNTLELHQMKETTDDEDTKALMEAGIQQKTEQLTAVPFGNAINLKENKKYIKYVLTPFLLIVLVTAWSPEIILESSGRIIDHRGEYTPKAPFQFNLQNTALESIRSEDFKVEVSLTGTEIPEEVFVIVNGQKRKMRSGDSDLDFAYTLRNVQDDVQFQFYANGFFSSAYELKVRPKPAIRKFDVYLDYPEYTQKAKKQLENTGDFSIPEGTKVKWQFHTGNTEKVEMAFKDTTLPGKQKQEFLFAFERSFRENASYSITLSNQFLESQEAVTYYINVIPDAYPVIEVKEFEDSLTKKRKYFSGEIADDYGFKALNFVYEHYQKDRDTTIKSSYALSVDAGVTNQRFNHDWDLSKLSLKQGDELSYYFEVWDNDGINGSKSSKSKVFNFKAPTRKELAEQTEKSNKQIKEDMEKAFQESQEIKEEFQKTRSKLLDKQKMDWEDKQRLEENMQRQKNLEKNIEQLKEQYRENVSRKNDFDDISEQDKEKMEQLYQKFDDLVSDEMKELMEELEKLMDKELKDKIEEELKKMDQKGEDMSKDLDRMKEHFKQMEMDMKMDNIMEELNELGDKQEELANKMEEGEMTPEESEAAQQELNEAFEKLQEEMREAEQMNQELDNPKRLPDTKDQEEQVKQKMQESIDQIKQDDQEGAQQKQKDAAQKLKEMSEDMQAAMADLDQEQIILNHRHLRQILSNLIQLSFDQEEMMEEFAEIRQYNPKFVALGQKQRALLENARIIEDSLQSLSKKVVEIESFVNKEMGEIKYQMDNAVEAFSDRKMHKIRQHQQSAMTSTNNLANLLTEILDKMQDSMQQQANSSGDEKSGDQECDSPGDSEDGDDGEDGQMKFQSLKEMQEQMEQRLQDLKDGKLDGKQMSEEMARIAAEQEMIRRKLQEKMKQANEELKKELGDMQELMDQMEENEEDLVNKRVKQETIERHREIMVRLLEAERAEKEQEFDDQRLARSAKDLFNTNPPPMDKFQREKEKELEMIKTVPPSLNPFYQEKVRNYFKGLQTAE